MLLALAVASGAVLLVLALARRSERGSERANLPDVQEFPEGARRSGPALAEPPAPSEPGPPARDAASGVRAPAPPAAAWAFLGGGLRQPTGEPVLDLPVSLRRGAGEVVASTTSDARGSFRFFELLPGDYELVLGDPEGPVLPPRAIAVGADGLDLGVLDVPELGRVLVRVLDEQGRPSAGAAVQGTGTNGGRVAGTSDDEGRLACVHLPPGEYRLFAHDARSGRGTTVFALGAGGACEVEIRLRSTRPGE